MVRMRALSNEYVVINIIITNIIIVIIIIIFIRVGFARTTPNVYLTSGTYYFFNL